MGEYYIKQPDELYHYGVKGMKWGVRKEPYTKDQIRQRRKQLVESAPYKTGRYQKAPSKGYWKNASDAQIAKLMDSEAKQVRKANKKPMSTAKKVAIGVAVAATVAGVTYAAVKTGKARQLKRGMNAVKMSRVTINQRKLTGHSQKLTRHGANVHRQDFYTNQYNRAAKSGRFHDAGRYGKAQQEAREALTKDWYAGKTKVKSTTPIRKLKRKTPGVATFQPKSMGLTYTNSSGQRIRQYGNRAYKIRG